MRVGLTAILCATLPLAAGFAFLGHAGAQDMQYGGPAAVGAPVPTMPVGSPPMTGMTRDAQLEQQVRELTNQLEQRDYQIRQLQQNFDKFSADTNQRLQTLEGSMSGTITGTGANAAPMAPMAEQPYSPPTPTPVQNSQTGSGVTGSVGNDPNGAFRPLNTPQLGQLTETAPNSDGTITSGRPQGVVTAAQAYDQAFAYLQETQYGDAQRAFTDFLAKYPSHPLAANAQYWLGETYFAQTQYPTAAKTFAKAFQEHPQGQKAPDALLKLALTLDKMNKKEDACLTLGELSKRFPSGPASVLRRGTEEAARMGCKT